MRSSVKPGAVQKLSSCRQSIARWPVSSPARARRRAPAPPLPIVARSRVPAGSSRSAGPTAVRNCRTSSTSSPSSGEDDDGTGMLDDIAGVLATLGVGDRVDPEREIPPAMDDAPLEGAFGQVPIRPRSQHRTRAGCGRRVGSVPVRVPGVVRGRTPRPSTTSPWRVTRGPANVLSRRRGARSRDRARALGLIRPGDPAPLMETSCMTRYTAWRSGSRRSPLSSSSWRPRSAGTV